MNQELVRAQPAGGAVVTADHYRDDYLEKLKVLKDVIAPGTTDTELQFFAEVCKRRRLDPFTRQIHCVKRKGKKDEDAKITIQTGIDGFRVIAERTGKYEGQLGPYWCGADGKWVDVWLKPGPPAASKVAILRTGFREPLWAVAHYTEYVQTYWDSGKQVPNSMWQKMPAGQLAKCSEALAFRKAFPEELSGIYAPEEMGNADNEDSTVSQQTTKPEGGNARASAAKNAGGGSKPSSASSRPSTEQVPTGNGGDSQKGAAEGTPTSADGGGRGDTQPSAEPTAVDALVAEFRAGDKWHRLKMFGELKADIVAVTGDETEYRRILNQHGVEKSDQFKDLQTAKQCLVALFNFLHAYQQAIEPDPAPPATMTEDREDWVPEIIGGKVEVSA